MRHLRYHLITVYIVWIQSCRRALCVQSLEVDPAHSSVPRSPFDTPKHDLATSIGDGTANDGDAAGVDIDATIHQALSILRQAQQKHKSNPTQSKHRPFVTLAFAQSMDGKLARVDMDTGRPSQNLPLSSSISQRFTHAVRSVHDGILVGGATWSTDQPQLTNRLWKQHAQEQQQPIPIVLDTHLRAIRANRPNSRRVIVCCSEQAAAAWKEEMERDAASDTMIQLLPCRCLVDNDGERLDLMHALQQLKETCGIETLMVEGGPTVLDACMNSLSVVDCVAITLALYTILGDSTGLTPYRQQSTLLQAASNATLFQMGDDMLILHDLQE